MSLPVPSRDTLSTCTEQANEFLKQYIPYYNRKFAVQAANPEKAYLPKKNISALELIFAKHETRKLNSGLAFSFEGQKYRMPICVDNQKIPASPHDTITVATSKRIGIQVLFKGLVIKPEPLKIQPKESILQMSQQDNSLMSLPAKHKIRPKNKSPWFEYTEMFYSKRHRDDISADQLSP